MSVIIEGMEMPKNCWLCPLSVLYEKPREMLRCKLTKEEVLREKIDGDCPLTELPPHGRLIDGDRPVGNDGTVFSCLFIAEYERGCAGMDADDWDAFPGGRFRPADDG